MPSHCWKARIRHGLRCDFLSPPAETVGLRRSISRRTGSKGISLCGISGATRHACNRIDEKLSDYLVGGSEAVNFEHIFHCAQEILANTFEPTAGAFNEFRPILYPFVGRCVASNEQTALTELVRRIPELLFSKLSAASDDPRISLAPLTEFLDHLRKRLDSRDANLYDELRRLHSASRSRSAPRLRYYPWQRIKVLHGRELLGFRR